MIIAGGRDYYLGPEEFEWLDQIASSTGKNIHEVVCGGARGADEGGEKWANEHGFQVTKFMANWVHLGLFVGPARNREMVKYAVPDGIVALFPGGKGTASMHKEAIANRLTVFVYVPEKSA